MKNKAYAREQVERYPGYSRDPIGAIVDTLLGNIAEGRFDYAQKDYAALKYELRKGGKQGKSIRHARNSLGKASRGYLDDANKLRLGKQDSDIDRSTRLKEAARLQRKGNLAAFYAGKLPAPIGRQRESRKTDYLSSADTGTQTQDSYSVADRVAEAIATDPQNPLLKSLIERLRIEGDYAFTIADKSLQEGFRIMSNAVEQHGISPDKIVQLFIDVDTDPGTLETMLQKI